MSENQKYLKNLPKVDTNQEIQENSLDALNTLLPKDSFCLRDERINDYGVDASLEVLENGLATNFRSQIQLKGTRSLEPNKDGSYSLQVETSNLNYLLNNPITVYILYIEPQNEFRFVWARNEFQRLDKENAGWIEQESVTIRFNNILDLASLDEIKDQITKQSSFNRELNETLVLAQVPNVLLEINSETFEINDSEKIKEFILSRGIVFCISGYSEQILDKIGLLETKDRKVPKIQIIKAIAEFELNLYQRAKETLTIMEANNQNLSEDEDLIKTFIKLHCNFQTGKIEHSEFLDGLKNLAPHRNMKIPFNFRLSYLKNAINAEKDVKKRRELFNSLKDEVEKDINKESLNKIDLRNRLNYLDLEGHQLCFEFTEEIGKLLLKAGKGYHANFESALIEHNKIIENWENKVNEIGNLFPTDFIADIYCLKASIFIHRQSTLMLLSKHNHFYGVIPNDVINSFKGNLKFAFKVYSESNLLERKLRAETLFAQINILENQDKEANEILSKVSLVSDDMSYANVKYLADNPLSRNVKEALDKKVDSIERDANLDDETITSYSQQQIDAFNIPQDRLENIMRRFFFLRDRAFEKLNWCEDLEILEDMKHTFHPSTYYSINPNRQASCVKHLYKLDFIDPDWKQVISKFKENFCENCSDRKPKNS